MLKKSKATNLAIKMKKANYPRFFSRFNCEKDFESYDVTTLKMKYLNFIGARPDNMLS